MHAGCPSVLTCEDVSRMMIGPYHLHIVYMSVSEHECARVNAHALRVRAPACESACASRVHVSASECECARERVRAQMTASASARECECVGASARGCVRVCVCVRAGGCDKGCVHRETGSSVCTVAYTPTSRARLYARVHTHAHMHIYKHVCTHFAHISAQHLCMHFYTPCPCRRHRSMGSLCLCVDMCRGMDTCIWHAPSIHKPAVPSIALRDGGCTIAPWPVASFTTREAARAFRHAGRHGCRHAWRVCTTRLTTCVCQGNCAVAGGFFSRAVHVQTHVKT